MCEGKCGNCKNRQMKEQDILNGRVKTTIDSLQKDVDDIRRKIDVLSGEIENSTLSEKQKDAHLCNIVHLIQDMATPCKSTNLASLAKSCGYGGGDLELVIGEVTYQLVVVDSGWNEAGDWVPSFS